MTEPTEPNRPTPPPQSGPPSPPPQSGAPSAQPPPSEPTQPLPPMGGPPPQGPPPQGPPPGPGGGAPVPPKQPGLWRQATSTRGGTVAVVVAACLAALLVVTLVGGGLFAVARVVAGHDRGTKIERMADRRDGALPPGMQKKLDRMPGPAVPRGPGSGAGGQGKGLGGGLGNGLGPLLRGAHGLGDVQHGEFTVQGLDGKPTTMTLQRGSVTAATATKVTVKSADGFTASYAVDSSTRGRTSGLKAGDTVLVVATKDGAKAVVITGGS